MIESDSGLESLVEQARNALEKAYPLSKRFSPDHELCVELILINVFSMITQMDLGRILYLAKVNEISYGYSIGLKLLFILGANQERQ